MLKLAIVLALVAMCYAQPPPPPEKPKIPETFMAETLVHVREHDNNFQAPGKWLRNFESGMAREDAKFTIRNMTSEDERLELFDKHMAYDIHMNMTGTFCRKHELPEDLKMPMIWDWVNSDKAHGREEKDPRTGEMVDIWTIATERGLLSLIVKPTNLMVPVALISEERGREEDVRFVKFEAMAPPATDFMVPSACNM